MARNYGWKTELRRALKALRAAEKGMDADDALDRMDEDTMRNWYRNVNSSKVMLQQILDEARQEGIGS